MRQQRVGCTYVYINTILQRARARVSGLENNADPESLGSASAMPESVRNKESRPCERRAHSTAQKHSQQPPRKLPGPFSRARALSRGCEDSNTGPFSQSGNSSEAQPSVAVSVFFFFLYFFNPFFLFSLVSPRNSYWQRYTRPQYQCKNF